MWRFEFAVVADLTANVFAACFLLFLVGWQTGSFGSAPVEAPPEAVYRVEDVATLSGAARVDMLRRRSDDGALRLDLRKDHVLVLAPGRPAAKVDAGKLSEALADASGTAELYVFSNDLYYAVTAALAARHLGWREIDVPQALRGPPSAPFGWSEGFLGLIATRPDPAGFSAGLGRLLDAASSGKTGRGASAGQGDGGGAMAANTSLVERLAALAGTWLAWLCLAAGFGLAVFTEWRHPVDGLEEGGKRTRPGR